MNCHPDNAKDQGESTEEEVAAPDAAADADEAFDLEAEFNAVEDLIFNSAKKDIDPDLTRAMTEAEILDFGGGEGCQANLANAFDDILLDDEDMDMTLVGSEFPLCTYSGIHPVCRKVLKMRIWGIPPVGVCVCVF